MFRRVLCSLSLAASIVIVGSLSSYGVTPNERKIRAAIKITQLITQKKKPLIESAGDALVPPAVPLVPAIGVTNPR